MTNREKFTEIFGCEIAQRDTGEAIPGHCKILIASDKHFNEWLKQEYVQPSAQPEPEEFEWCHTCREYDQEKHCCHRWTKVIRKTVDDMKAAQPGWIPCSTELPKESGEYLVTIRYKDGGNDDTDLFEYNSHWREWNDGELFGGDVIAWQPKPKPWEGEKDDG